MTVHYSGVLWIVPSVLLCTVFTNTHGFNLTVMHTNDVHARIEEMNKYDGVCSSSDAAEDKCYGGMERLKTKIDELRSLYPNSLLLDAGDQYQGTLFFYAHGGQIMSHFMNVLGYNAMGLGNHEFDMGPEGLKPFLDNSTTKILSSNIDTSQVPDLSTIQKSAVFDFSGEKVGVVGYTTSSTPVISKPGKVKFSEEVASIQQEVTRLTNQGVNKIIALGHSGFRKDLEIAENVDGVDVIVGGHSNTFLYSGNAPSNNDPQGSYPAVIKNKNGDNVLVVQDYAYGKYLGFLQVDFDALGKVTAWNGNPILLDKTVTKDVEVTQLIQAYSKKVESMKSEKIGVSLVHLDGDRANCRVRECSMGNLLTDAMVRQNMRYADSLEWNHVSIAIHNSGGIRASINKGDVTAAMCLSVWPFRNTIDIISLSGKVLKEVLEHSVSKPLDDPVELPGRFLQMSGIRVVYDTRRQIGDRVVRVTVMCTECSIPAYEALNMTKMYKVLVPAYLVEGGDGYSVIKDNVGITHTIGDLDSQLLLDYVRENSPVATGLEGRIQFMQDFQDMQLCEGTTFKSSIALILISLSCLVVLGW